MKILVIEDHERIAKNISQFLRLEGYEVNYELSLSAAEKNLTERTYDILLLDINLPDGSWKEFCKDLRKRWNKIPIIMLTSQDSQKDIIDGLKSWADDYISKPFDYDELLARIDSLMRRWNIISTAWKQQIWDIKIDFNKKQVSRWEEYIHLSTLEYRLYEYLVKNIWRVIDRNELYEKVWREYDILMFSRTVDVYVNYVRKKLWKNSIKTRMWEWYFIED